MGGETNGQHLKVIAKGTSESRVAAANLLFHYWPFANPHILHRKIIHTKCCYDPMICADVADTSPPVFLCKKCAENVIAERKVVMHSLTQPMPTGNGTCQNKLNTNLRNALKILRQSTDSCTKKVQWKNSTDQRFINYVSNALADDLLTHKHEEHSLQNGHRTNWKMNRILARFMEDTKQKSMRSIKTVRHAFDT
uniref:Helitron_like_N domain-containing protein n=1 Tax=Heterorhabditis bacteriophora TaxID=37862 RepID=A0A1I7WFN2_HETBA